MTKLNKQGVRDLSALGKQSPAPMPGSFVCGPGTSEDFGKNQLPGELAEKLLKEQPVEFGAALTPVQREFLEILAEECAETIQRVTKILRFGVRKNPWDGKDNIERLESEIGDILAVLTVLGMAGIVDPRRVDGFAETKLKAFAVEEDPTRPRIRHMNDGLRAAIFRALAEVEAL